MRQFQKDNNITKQCMTNSQYLYDTIKMNSSYTNVYIQYMYVYITIYVVYIYTIYVYIYNICAYTYV